MNQKYSFTFFLVALQFYSSSFCFSQSHDLNYYLVNGIQNSPLLKDYSNQIEQKKFDSLLIMAGKKITVDATGLVFIAPIINGVGYDEAITNKGQYTAVAGVQKTLFQKNSLNAQVKQSQIQSGIISISAKITERELQKAITDQYLKSYSNISSIKFEEQTIASLQNQLALLEPLVKNGIYLQTDYLTLQLQIESEKINLQQLRDEYRSNLYTLNALCGIADTTTLEIAKPDLVWRSTSTYTNPNLQLYSLDSTAIEASKDLLHYSYVPKVNLFGDAGYNAIPAAATFQKFGFSAGVSVAWNIYDGGKKNLQTQQLTLQQTTFDYYKSNYSIKLNIQLADLNKKIVSSNSIITQLQNQLSSMSKLVSLRRQQLEAGQLSIIDYLSVVRDNNNLQKKLNDAVINQQQIINEHNYLIW